MRNALRIVCSAAVALALVGGADTLQAQGRGNGGTPPGLAKKPHGMPPGQAKKIYRPDDGIVVMRDVFGRHGYTVVRVAPYNTTSRYVYYRRGRTGTLHRAVVRPGTERLVFENVPTLLLREVVARLY